MIFCPTLEIPKDNQQQIMSGRISPKILIKQQHVHDTDNVFIDSGKGASGGAEESKQNLIDSKSVGFA